MPKGPYAKGNESARSMIYTVGLKYIWLLSLRFRRNVSNFGRLSVIYTGGSKKYLVVIIVPALLGFFQLCREYEPLVARCRSNFI